MGNVLPKGPVRTDIAMVKIKGGGTNRIAIRKTFDEEKKELTKSNGIDNLSPVNMSMINIRADIKVTR